jgi:methylated-DNA-[protein]-cysteine S-methyltransferase
VNTFKRLNQVEYPALHAYFAKIGKVWYCAVLNSDGLLASSQFSLRSRNEAVDKACCRFRRGEVKVMKAATNRAKYALRALAEIFEGRKTVNLPHLSMYGLTEFSRKALYAVRKIPKGYVSTYSEVANTVGAPRGGRAVGNIMASNPLVLAVPCHRVLRSDLTIGGYSNNPAVKRQLLEREGVQFQNRWVAEKCLYRFNRLSKA